VVDTGAASLTELGFNDSSILRLGSNTQFSFQSKERIIKLDKGTMLMNVPPGNGGITVDGGGVTGAVSGTTVMASRDEEGNFSFMILEGEGSGKVIGKDGVPVDLIPGQMAIVRQDGKPTKVVEVNVDAMRDYSPLYTDFSSRLPGSDRVQGTTDRQAEDVQNEVTFLQGPTQQGLEASGPGVKALAMLAGMSSAEIDNSRNILLGDSTAAGQEGGGEGSGSGAGGGRGSLVAFNDSNSPTDARQEDAAPLVAASSPPSSGDDGGLGGTDTAAGGEGGGGGEGDLGATETAAGGTGGADTQAPLAPAGAPPPVTSSPSPGLTTPV
ncbi:MAG: FecR domain-containing protein, partial [Verrucomicrobiota bacterium]